ncbi:competence protein ComGC [Cerasibacillus quisquiliarum]|uniref:Competence protein ComGC n=1 Tax=Cerasibacillus quisquiliarum TaxID=227865 RepID=A0A511UWV2_9BACI|nr:competence type IV pilus major pilin ComGC [Cerasibacillus quisquiliarum]MBB5145495.1 competence protein ComGC [Cerasibacillus quisquiliarum]GEN31110.1 competence protein ComGC [Cerasibacillus quisquiliarum]
MISNQKAFTLIEMLIVLLIISVLIILIVPNLSGKTKDVNTKGCDALVAVVQAQVESYALDNGVFPHSLQSLVTEEYITEKQLYCGNKGDRPLRYDAEKGRVLPPSDR